jgi:hypothetical protein
MYCCMSNYTPLDQFEHLPCHRSRLLQGTPPLQMLPSLVTLHQLYVLPLKQYPENNNVQLQLVNLCSLIQFPSILTVFSTILTSQGWSTKVSIKPTMLVYFLSEIKLQLQFEKVILMNYNFPNKGNYQVQKLSGSSMYYEY